MKLLLARIAISLRTHPFESLFLLPLLLFYAWYILALTGLFYGAFVLLIFLIVFLGTIFFLSKRPALCSLSNIALSVFLLSFVFLAFTTHPIEPVSEGRDQGTFINSALLLRENNGLPFRIAEALPFFEIYGPGKALHFPGLAYTESGALIPEFPLGYIVWLGGFVTLFGISGLAIANSLLYILSGLLFSTLLKRILPTSKTFLVTLLFMGGFLPLWFVSFTLTENLALFLFLLTAESTIRFRITKDRVTLFLCFASAFALALTRIEGWGILFVTFLIVNGGRVKKDWLKIYIFEKPLVPVITLLLGLLITTGTLLLNSPYYEAIIKELFKSAEQNIGGIPLDKEVLPLYWVLWKYGLFVPLLGGLLGCLYLWKAKRQSLLYPFFLSAVTLPYLLLPHITFDAPWMLRRFLFALYPALFLSLCFVVGIFIKRLEGKKQAWAWRLFLLLLASIQIPLLKQFSQTSYSHTLLPQVQNLSTYFSARDLILVDKEVTGDNFMIPARILSVVHDRPAVYFFNPSDFEKLNTKSFERVFLVVPEEKKDFYGETLASRFGTTREFTFSNDHSFRATDLSKNILPEKTDNTTKILIIELK